MLRLEPLLFQLLLGINLVSTSHNTAGNLTFALKSKAAGGAESAAPLPTAFARVAFFIKPKLRNSMSSHGIPPKNKSSRGRRVVPPSYDPAPTYWNLQGKNSAWPSGWVSGASLRLTTSSIMCSRMGKSNTYLHGAPRGWSLSREVECRLERCWTKLPVDWKECEPDHTQVQWENAMFNEHVKLFVNLHLSQWIQVLISLLKPESLLLKHMQNACISI